MNTISIEKAIKEEKTYFIHNKFDTRFTQFYYFLINGNIRFISLNKRKLQMNDETKYFPIEYFENTLIELEIEYVNLNHFDTDISIFKNNDCYLVDANGYHFDIDSVVNDNGINYFIPKVKQKVKLKFLVPNEETEYIFNINRAEFIEKE